MNIIQIGDDSCPLCSGASKIVDHLFFECLISWKLGTDCYAWWEFYWCCHNKPIPFLEAWSGVKLHRVEKKMCMTLYYVVIWSIWLIRNRIVFENAKLDWEWKKR